MSFKYSRTISIGFIDLPTNRHIKLFRINLFSQITEEHLRQCCSIMENELMHPFMNDLDDLRVDQNLPILTNILKDICNTVEVTNIQNREYFFPTCDGNPTELCVWWEVPIYYNDEFTDRYEHSIVWPESIDHTRYMESFGAMLEIMREKGFLQ